MKIGILSVIYGKGANKYINRFILNQQNNESYGYFIRMIVDHGSHQIPNDFWLRNNIIYISQNNKGFGAGVNTGLSALFNVYQCDYVLVMNPDINFCYDELFELCDDLKEDFYVLRLDELGNKKSILYYSYIWGDIKLNKSLFTIPYFNGAAFLISRKLYNNNIKFDERYFMYFEDIDYSYNLYKLNININELVTQKMYHDVAGCTDSNNRVYIEKIAAISGLKFAWKNFPLNIVLYLRYIIKYLVANYRY